MAQALKFGFRNGNNIEGNLEKFEAFPNYRFVDWVPVTLKTVDRFSRIATVLRKKGRPLPTNNIWIAAHTIETGADLLSYDRYFEAIEGLSWIPLTQ